MRQRESRKKRFLWLSASQLFTAAAIHRSAALLLPAAPHLGDDASVAVNILWTIILQSTVSRPVALMRGNVAKFRRCALPCWIPALGWRQLHSCLAQTECGFWEKKKLHNHRKIKLSNCRWAMVSISFLLDPHTPFFKIRSTRAGHKCLSPRIWLGIYFGTFINAERNHPYHLAIV